MLAKEKNSINILFITSFLILIHGLNEQNSENTIAMECRIYKNQIVYRSKHNRFAARNLLKIISLISN